MLEYITINITAETLCFIVAIFTLSKNTDWLWRSSIGYLFITCVIELIGKYLKMHHQPNQWPYNALLVFHIFYTLFIFKHILDRYIKSMPMIISGLALLLTMYAYELIMHGFFEFNQLTYNTMSVFFVICSLYYFYELLKDSRYTGLEFSADFWWAAATLLFYFGSTAVNLFRGQLSVKVTPNHYLTYYIYIVLNILLSLGWSYSFICRKWLTTISKN